MSNRDLGRLNGFSEDIRPANGRKGPHFSGLGVFIREVFGVKTVLSNSFLSQKADSKEISAELVKSWRLDQVRGP